MKRAHEADRANDLKDTSSKPAPGGDLLALGPNIVCFGELVTIDGSEWTLRLQNFFIGDFHALVGFIDGFETFLPADRYVLVNAIGDGRTLVQAPSVTRDSTGYTVRCRVSPSFPRIAASDLPTDFALSPKNDLTLEKGNIAVVSGVAALPQKVRTCLSHQKGESPFHTDFGTRLAEYYGVLRGSPWFEHLFKLEVIRQAAIPYSDIALNRQYTPLQCVERVFGIDVLADAPKDNWLPIRVDLGVKGIGRWQQEILICVPTNSP